jgi:PAS domain S-box-containing protein
VVSVIGALWLLLREHSDDVSSALVPDAGTARLSRLLGYEPADLLGSFSLDSVHPDDRGSVSRAWAELVDHAGQVATFRYRVKQDDHRWRWVDATGANLSGEPSVQAVVINRRDVTDEVENQLRLEHEVALRTRELESLYRADSILRRSLRISDVLQATVDVAADVLAVEHSIVFVHDGLHDRWLPRASCGFDQQDVWRLAPAFDSQSSGTIVSSGLPLGQSVDSIAPSESWDGVEVLRKHGIRSVFSVPLVVANEAFAVFSVFNAAPRALTETERRSLLALAERAGMAIETAQLYEAAREKAALEERQKLARELHDSVSQALYAIGLTATAASRLFASDPARVPFLMDDVVRLAETGLTEMRSLIFELRPESIESEGLVGALEKQAAAVRARHGLLIRTAFGSEPQLPLNTKQALYRIAQEALHNTAKHAQAKLVDLELRTNEGELLLRIADDGHGFQTDGKFPGHLGLKSMRERAVAMGATLDVRSSPQAGTEVRVHLPLASSLTPDGAPAVSLSS